MKTLTWKGEQGSISGVGSVTKGSEFTIDDKRAESFIKQGQAQFKEDADDNVEVKVSKVKSKKSEVN